tara:strand:- start:1188 stop:1829 length:642 start_codon:yes stop_codon:yes gene_type:complete
MSERTLANMSELQAVNMMLTTIGEQPIANLNDKAGLQDASIAQDILHNTSRQVQSRGWIFNTDLQKILSPDSTTAGGGKIKVDSNVLRIDTTSKVRSNKTDIVERAGYLYDREKNTNLFTDPVTVDYVTFLPFESIPESARRYIAVKSARVFHDRVVGSGELHAFFQQDEMQAWSDLLEYQSEIGDFNIFDDYDTFRVLDRNQDSNQHYAWRK